MLRAEILGNLGADAEMREYNGARFCSFNVADTQKFTDATTGAITERTTWVSCTINREVGGLLPYLKCGTKVFLRGNIAPKMYVGHDGQKHAGINLFVTEIELAGGRETAMKDVKDFILTQPEARQEIYDYLITFADQNQENEVQSENRSTSRGRKARK